MAIPDYQASILPLLDGKTLSNLMIDFGVGVASVSTYEVKKIDLDYFTEG